MNNHTLLRLLPIAASQLQIFKGVANAPKNIWGNYAVENPDLESYYKLYLSI